MDFTIFKMKPKFKPTPRRITRLRPVRRYIPPRQQDEWDICSGAGEDVSNILL